MKIDWLSEVVSSSLREVCKQKLAAERAGVWTGHRVVDDKGAESSERLL